MHHIDVLRRIYGGRPVLHAVDDALGDMPARSLATLDAFDPDRRAAVIAPAVQPAVDRRRASGVGRAPRRGARAAPLVASVLAWADAHLGLGLGPLDAAPDVRRA